VRQAIDDGILHETRYQSFLKLKKELKNLAYRQRGKAILEKKKEEKRLSKTIKRMKKGK
jgi:flagellar motility protein MotE (MotC chaperone)